MVVCHFPEQSVFSVYSKDVELKWQSVSYEHAFPTALNDAIFSETHLVHALHKSTLAPLGEPEYAPFFEVNFGKGYATATQDSELFTVVYEKTAIAYENSLVSAKHTTDIDVVYRYAAQKNYPNAVYVYHVEDVVTVLAWKDGLFALANRYTADNEDELFYYVMLVVEQLELSAADIHFSLLGTRNQHTSYHKLFQNYLAPLHLGNAEQASDASLHSQLADYFGRCVL